MTGPTLRTTHALRAKVRAIASRVRARGASHENRRRANGSTTDGLRESRRNHSPGIVSRLDVLDHAAMHVGQQEVAALEAVRQLLEVDAQTMQQRGVEVVDVHRL